MVRAGPGRRERDGQHQSGHPEAQPGLALRAFGGAPLQLPQLGLLRIAVRPGPGGPRSGPAGPGRTGPAVRGGLRTGALRQPELTDQQGEEHPARGEQQQPGRQRRADPLVQRGPDQRQVEGLADPRAPLVRSAQHQHRDGGHQQRHPAGHQQSLHRAPGRPGRPAEQHEAGRAGEQRERRVGDRPGGAVERGDQAVGLGALQGGGGDGGGRGRADREGEGPADGVRVLRDGSPGDGVGAVGESGAEPDPGGVVLAVGVRGAARVDRPAGRVEHPHRVRGERDGLAEGQGDGLRRDGQDGVLRRVGGLQGGVRGGRSGAGEQQREDGAEHAEQPGGPPSQQPRRR